MSTKTLSAEEAIAYGALEADVCVVTGYPGSPSSGTLQALLSLADADEVAIEWSVNEKVALEVAIGASLAGQRALVCVKSVGMNVLIDPLMTLNLTGVHGGLVLLLGDDPGAYGSQNDQDTRPIAQFADVPLWEPSSAREAKAMTEAAFCFSERHRTAVILRGTRSFSRLTGDVEIASSRRPRSPTAMIREPFRWTPLPHTAVRLHEELRQKIERIGAAVESSPFNDVFGDGSTGVVAAGFTYSKLSDVIGVAHGRLRVFKLATTYPLPVEALTRFMEKCDEVLVLEENEPFVERQLKVIAYDSRLQTRILGKLSKHTPVAGELFRWQIVDALRGVVKDFAPAADFSEEGEASERPAKADPCAGCPFLELVTLFKEAGAELGVDPVLVGDPGCLVKAGHLLDAKYAMGSAAAVVQGLTRAGESQPAVAIFGDSAFFHSALQAVVNAVQMRTPVLLVVLDNSATVTSGWQPNPGTGQDARSHAAPKLSIAALAEAVGVDWVRTVEESDSHEKTAAERRRFFQEALAAAGTRLLVVRCTCERVVVGRSARHATASN